MKLKDLKQGMVCILRNKDSITVASRGYYFTSSFYQFALEKNYNEDLTHKDYKTLDIKEVTYGDKVVFKRNESNRWYEPGHDEKYFYINEFGDIDLTTNTQISDDIYILNNNRVFKTREEAEKRLKQQQATLSVERWIAENDVDVDVYDTDVLKCGVYYYDEVKEFGVMSSRFYVYMPKQFILSSEEKAKQLIKEREKELKIMFGVEE